MRATLIVVGGDEFVEGADVVAGDVATDSLASPTTPRSTAFVASKTPNAPNTERQQASAKATILLRDLSSVARKGGALAGIGRGSVALAALETASG